MSLFTASLNSGSNGNCYYFGNQQDAILIDAGISCREIERRMKRLSLSMKKVKAIFVTHEHSDHIFGLSKLSKKYQLPVYITEPTMKQGRLSKGLLTEKLSRTISFHAYEPITIGNLSVTAFPTQHDASDPHNFIVTCDTVKVGVFTDIGHTDDHVIRNFEQCHAAYLEANYDEELLETGTYPEALKDRIRGGQGHLSNKQSLELFLNHRPDHMSLLFPSHLSANNNSQTIVRNLFTGIAGATKIIIASRYKETPVYIIQNTTGQDNKPLPMPDQLSQLLRKESFGQLSLFE